MVVFDLDSVIDRPLDGLAALRQMWPAMRLVVISSSQRDHDIVRCVELGVNGYVLKTDSTATLCRAFEQVLDDKLYVPEVDFGLQRACA